MSWERGRWIAASVAGLVVVVVAIGFVFPSDVWRVKFGGDGLTFSFLREEERRVLLADDFSTPSELWNVRTEPGATVRIADGALQIRILEPETFDYEAPALPVDAEALRVEATTTFTAGQDATVFGLLCAESAGPSATHSGNAGGYVLAFHPATRTARIGHFPGPLDEKILETETLVERKLPASWRAGAAVEITAECGSVVEIQVDGITAASTVRARSQKFDGAGIVVINTADDPIEVRVDRFAVFEGS